jgi:hypothetical protein
MVARVPPGRVMGALQLEVSSHLYEVVDLALDVLSPGMRRARYQDRRSLAISAKLST